MDIQIAVLCDAATNTHEKLNILGTFDTIYSPKFPAVHPQCAVAIRMSFNKSEEGSHKVKLQFVDEDGKPFIQPIEMPVEVVVPEDSIFLSRNFIVNFQNLKFEKEGALLGGHRAGRPARRRHSAARAPAPPGRGGRRRAAFLQAVQVNDVGVVVLAVVEFEGFAAVVRRERV